MTRINVGIPPAELCDQHLIAEYRELPRLFSFVSKRTPPAAFTLGTGHVLWCAQYQGSLALRQASLIAEMARRGFRTSHAAPEPSGGYWSPADEERARPIVRERIACRLKGMKRAPKWTDRP